MYTPPASVLVSIVNYKTADLVAGSLPALAAEYALCKREGINVRAVIVDNASGETERLRQAARALGDPEWIQVLASDTNGGFAFGNNLAIKSVFDAGCMPDFVFLLNPDAVVTPGAILELIGFLRTHPRAGIAGSRVDQSATIAWRKAFRFPSWLSEFDSGLGLGLVTRLLQKHVVARTMGDKDERVDWVSGSALMVRSELIRQAGAMDESYFLYFEELDFCRKVTHRGWEIWYVAASRVFHSEGAASGIGTSATRGEPPPAYWFESRRRYFVKNHGLAYSVLTDGVFVAGYLANSIRRRLGGRAAEARPGYLKEFLRHSSLVHPKADLKPAREWVPTRI